jgi:hypothetical protein
MPVLDEYRRHADECVRAAQMVNDPVDRTLLLQMAQAWRHLAQRAEAQKKAVDQNEDLDPR